jgi:hypothetical protein
MPAFRSLPSATAVSALDAFALSQVDTTAPTGFTTREVTVAQLAPALGISGNAVYVLPGSPPSNVGNPNDVWFDVTTPSAIVMWLRQVGGWINATLSGGGGSSGLSGGLLTFNGLQLTFNGLDLEFVP